MRILEMQRSSDGKPSKRKASPMLLPLGLLAHFTETFLSVILWHGPRKIMPCPRSPAPFCGLRLSMSSTAPGSKRIVTLETPLNSSPLGVLLPHRYVPLGKYSAPPLFCATACAARVSAG